jgi:hypothetical protein
MDGSAVRCGGPPRSAGGAGCDGGPPAITGSERAGRCGDDRRPGTAGRTCGTSRCRVDDHGRRAAARRNEGDPTNGADALLRTPVGCGVEVCFANPARDRGHRRRRRVPGPPGLVPAGRRQRHVHHLGAVDARPRRARRHHRDIPQQRLRDPADGAGGARRDRGPAAAGLLDLGRPELDFTALARGTGVPAVRVTTVDELADALRRARAEPGPRLVEAMVRPWSRRWLRPAPHPNGPARMVGQVTPPSR